MEAHPLEFCVLRMKERSLVTDSVQWDVVLDTAICIATSVTPGIFSFLCILQLDLFMSHNNFFLVPMQKQLLN